MAGTSPEGAERSNYYYPLAILYYRVCFLACGSDTKPSPKVVQLTWFTDGGGRTRTVLGGSLSGSSTSIEAARLRRVAALISKKLIDYKDIDESYVLSAATTISSGIGGERPTGQLFGHCSETWPWLYIALCEID